jgi:hypothetical protein
MLTMDYVSEKQSDPQFYLALQSAPVLQTLQKNGYRLRCTTDSYATRNFYPIQYATCVQRSALYALQFALVQSLIWRWSCLLYSKEERRQAVRDALESLLQTPDHRPFVHYCHVVCPHLPNLFDDAPLDVMQGQQVVYDGNNEQIQQDARASIAGIDAMVLPVLRQIIEKEKSHPPIIILHSDHGMRTNHHDLESVYGNLLALYIPDPWKPHAKNLHFINLYRFILNHLFDMHLPYHKDNDQKITLEEYLKYGK